MSRTYDHAGALSFSSMLREGLRLRESSVTDEPLLVEIAEEYVKTAVDGLRGTGVLKAH
jgi:hypothetical protein